MLTPTAGAVVAALLAAASVLIWPSGRLLGSRLPVRTGVSPRSQRFAERRAPGREVGTTPWRRGPAVGPAQDSVSATVVMELVAAALQAGLPGPQAVEAAAVACGPDVAEHLAPALDAWRLGIAAECAWAGVDPAFGPLARSLVLAERTGASASVVLVAAAADARSARQRRAVVAARRLGVQLVLPLGLTTLPAFVLIGVVPVVLGLATTLLGVE
jgi:hypothetical protein